MPMTHIPLSDLETEAGSVDSKTSTLQDIANPSVMSNTQSDILQIIRKEEDHAMSLLAASPLLSSLFLTYASRATALDGPPAPSPVDVEWTEMKTLNTRLQEEVTLLRAQLDKETDRAKMAEDCVEALRAQLSSVKDANRDLETAVSNERAKLDAITSEYAEHQEEAEEDIAELRDAVKRGASARAALSEVIADQQATLAKLKEQNGSPCPLPVKTKESQRPDAPAPAKRDDAMKQIDPHKQWDNPKQPEDTKRQDDANRRNNTYDPVDENRQDASERQDTTRSHGDATWQSSRRKGPVTNKTVSPFSHLS